MDVNKKSIWYQAANYGLILGLIIIFSSLVVYKFDLLTKSLFAGVFISIFNFIIYAVTIFILTKKYRDNILDGKISYNGALTFGILIGVFASIISAFYELIFDTIIAPDYKKIIFEKYLIMLQDFLISLGGDVEEIESKISELNNNTVFQSPVSSALQSIPWTIMGFLIVSLISSIFVKKVDSNPFTNISEQ